MAPEPDEDEMVDANTPKRGGRPRVGASFDIKIGLPNYGHISAAFWETSDVPEGVTAEQHRRSIHMQLREELREVAESIKTSNPKPVIP